jgi:hypothetical protein
MAADTTQGTVKNGGGPDTADIEQQLSNLIDLLEAIDWRDVDGISTAEAATLTARVDDARERTRSPTVATDGGRETLAGLDAIVHDATQLTLGSFERGSRGPYPSHPFGGVADE